MHRLLEGFVRVTRGEYLCRSRLIISGPDGAALTTTPGITYRTGKNPSGDLDLAKVLDKVHDEGTLPPGVAISE